MYVERPDWDQYFLGLARQVATRATCPRRRVGAVLVLDRRVVATGYNGSVRGDAHCDDAGCIMEHGHCIRCIHAELNALLQCAANGQSCAGATMYCTDYPCLNCAKALVQAGVTRVVYLQDYPAPHTEAILACGGVQVVRVAAVAALGSDGDA